MTPNLRAAREQWLDDRPYYEELASLVVRELKQGCQKAGVYAWVTGRTKETASLMKKLVANGRGYDEITDKAGARIVVRFREQLANAEAVVQELYSVIRREDKSDALGGDKIGYQAVHFDVVLRESEPSLKGRRCEIQVRTLCQNLWAEISHQLSYKPGLLVDPDIERQINLLNALLELADRHFSAISDAIKAKGTKEERLVVALENRYYQFSGRPYSAELTNQMVRSLAPLYGDRSFEEIHQSISAFLDSQASKINGIFEQYDTISEPPLFLFQPEALMVFQLLERDPFSLEERWCTTQPRSELHDLSITWGTPLD